MRGDGAPPLAPQKMKIVKKKKKRGVQGRSRGWRRGRAPGCPRPGRGCAAGRPGGLGAPGHPIPASAPCCRHRAPARREGRAKKSQKKKINKIKKPGKQQKAAAPGKEGRRRRRKKGRGGRREGGGGAGRARGWVDARRGNRRSSFSSPLPPATGPGPPPPGARHRAPAPSGGDRAWSPRAPPAPGTAGWGGRASVLQNCTAPPGGAGGVVGVGLGPGKGASGGRGEPRSLGGPGGEVWGRGSGGHQVWRASGIAETPPGLSVARARGRHRAPHPLLGLPAPPASPWSPRASHPPGPERGGDLETSLERCSRSRGRL